MKDVLLLVVHLFFVYICWNFDFSYYICEDRTTQTFNSHTFINLTMFDINQLLTVLITSATTLLCVYLKEYLFPKKKQQKLTINKSNCYIELDRICAAIRDICKAQSVYIAHFHNGGHFINGVEMDKYTVVGEDYGDDLESHKKYSKDILVTNFPYLFHNLLVRNRHYVDDINEHYFHDKCYKDDLKKRNALSAYTFLIKDPISELPLGFISLEFDIIKGFNEDDEAEIWKKQNKIANLLNMNK